MRIFRYASRSGASSGNSHSLIAIGSLLSDGDAIVNPADGNPSSAPWFAMHCLRSTYASFISSTMVYNSAEPKRTP